MQVRDQGAVLFLKSLFFLFILGVLCLGDVIRDELIWDGMVNEMFFVHFFFGRIVAAFGY